MATVTQRLFATQSASAPEVCLSSHCLQFVWFLLHAHRSLRRRGTCSAAGYWGHCSCGGCTARTRTNTCPHWRGVGHTSQHPEDRFHKEFEQQTQDGRRIVSRYLLPYLLLTMPFRQRFSCLLKSQIRTTHRTTKVFSPNQLWDVVAHFLVRFKGPTGNNLPPKNSNGYLTNPANCVRQPPSEGSLCYH